MKNHHSSRNLGATGIRLFPVGLGAMQLSMNDHPDEAAAVEVIHAALAAGMNFIDTANVYFTEPGDIGHNERLVAKALSQATEGPSVTVAAKGGVDGLRRRIDASPQSLRASCIASLKALGRDAIDLYQLHAPDDHVPIEESVGELARLQDEGKIVHIGLSNVDSGELLRAAGEARIESVQNRCNPWEPDDYADGLLRLCEEREISYLPHGGLGGKSCRDAVARHPILVEIAARHDATPAAVVVAWHLHKSRVVIPIPGASRPESVRSSASAASLTLSADDLARLDGLRGG